MKKRFNPFYGKVILFILGIILSIFLLEILLRMQILAPPAFDNDGWWKYRWHTLKRNSMYTVTEFPDQFDPILGWIPKKKFSTTNEFGGLSFNSIGIRSKQEYQVQKQEKKRVVTIGDSFTYGECVGNDQTYSAYLEQILSNSEVLNFGVHGYGLDQQLLRLKKALAYSPDVVIIGFYNPDIGRILLSFREYHKPKYILNNGKLTLTNIPLPPPDDYNKHNHLLILDIAKMFFYAFQNRINPGQKYQRENKLAKAIFEEMEKITSETDSQFYLLYLPSYEEVTNNKSTPHEAFTSYCRQKKAKCINPTSSLYYYVKSFKNPSLLFHCHYAKEIHEQVAKEIKKTIEN